MSELGGVAVELPCVVAKPRGITSAHGKTIARWLYATSTTTLHSTRHDASTRQDRERGRDCLASQRRSAGATLARRDARAHLFSSPRPWCPPWGAGRASSGRPSTDDHPQHGHTTSVGRALASSKTTARQLQHVALLRCNDHERCPWMPETARQDLLGSTHPAGRCDIISPPRSGPRRNHADRRQRQGKHYDALRDTGQRPRCAARPRAKNASGNFVSRQSR